MSVERQDVPPDHLRLDDEGVNFAEAHQRMLLSGNHRHEKVYVLRSKAASLQGDPYQRQSIWSCCSTYFQQV
jgi:hypothetical protein